MSGKATFRLSFPGGRSFDLRLTRPYDFDPERPTWFLTIKHPLVPCDQWEGFKYLAILNLSDGSLIFTAKSAFESISRHSTLASIAVKILWHDLGEESSQRFGFILSHVDQCGKCGRGLQDPESKSSGLHADCDSVPVTIEDIAGDIVPEPGTPPEPKPDTGSQDRRDQRERDESEHREWQERQSREYRRQEDSESERHRKRILAWRGFRIPVGESQEKVEV